jgi:hypothetical protein
MSLGQESEPKQSDGNLDQIFWRDRTIHEIVSQSKQYECSSGSQKEFFPKIEGEFLELYSNTNNQCHPSSDCST